MASDVEDEVSEISNSERDKLESISSDTCVLKRKTKGFVWKYFGFETDRNGHLHFVNLPKCCLCQATVAVEDSNTSNLYSHLKSKHPEDYSIAQVSKKDLSEAKAVSSSSTDGLATLLSSWDKQWPLAFLSPY